MRGGDVVGAHGEGGCRRSIPDMGGVRWSLFVICRIGERVVIGGGFGWSGALCGVASGSFGSGGGGPGWLGGTCVDFVSSVQKSSP